MYDDETDTFIFGWNATDDSFFGWDAGGGRWNIGHMNYFVSEFRAPLLFVVMRFGLSENAIKNCGFKIKSYQMRDGMRKYALAPWSGSAFQGLGLSMFMQELKNPAWKIIMRNFVDIELDFAYRHNLPGFLSESYTGIETQYTGDVGIANIAVTGKERIIDSPSLYTLGVAYSVAPEKIEKFLAANWPVIETLLTDHGPWEGYNTTQKKIIEFQTTAHTLSLVLGALRTSQENMERYLNYKQLMPALARFYKPGRAVNIIQPTTRIDAWTSDGSAIEAKVVNGTFKMTAPNGIKTGGAKFTLAGANGADLSNGLLNISYSSKMPIEEAVIKFVRKQSSSIVEASIPNEIFTRFEKTDGKIKQIEIPLPATPGLDDIEAIELNIVDNRTKKPVDLTLQRFEFIPFDTALN